MPAKNHTTQNIEFVLEMLMVKFNHLLGATQALEKKAGLLTAFIPAILTSSLVLSKNLIGYNLYTFGLFLLLGALVTLCIIHYPTKWSYPPNEDILYSNESLNADLTDLKNQMAADIKRAFTDNLKTHQWKAGLYEFAVFLVTGGLIISALALFYYNWK